MIERPDELVEGQDERLEACTIRPDHAVAVHRLIALLKLAVHEADVRVVFHPVVIFGPAAHVGVVLARVGDEACPSGERNGEESAEREKAGLHSTLHLRCAFCLFFRRGAEGGGQPGAGAGEGSKT